MTNEYNENNTAELLKTLKAGVATLKGGEDWQKHLDTMARFHDYSFGNCMLIALQCAGATRVAGYRTWQKLGRHVRKGEHGIRILAPLVVKKKDADQEEGKALVGFRSVAVFDISQTDGEELPETRIFRPLEGGGEPIAAVFEALRKFAGAIGFPVTMQTLEGTQKGFTSYTPRQIVIGEQYGELQRTKTLAHELGHALLHSAEGLAGVEDLHRGTKEVEAESVAYVVMKAFGLDSAEYSIPYLASWAEGEADEILKSGQRIQNAAKRVIDACQPAEKNEEEREAA